MNGRKRWLAALVPIAALVAVEARGATLRAADGSRITVTRTRGGETGAVRSWDGGGGLLRYEMLDSSGRKWSGVVPGDLGGELAPALAQNPLTGEIVLVYSAVAGGSSDLVLHSWTGQGWTAPLWLTGNAASDLHPTLAFDGDGEAVLAWERDDRILVRHARLGGAGETHVSSFSDLGDPPLFAAGGDVRLGAGVAHVATDRDEAQAFLILADPLRDEVGVMELRMSVLGDIWGGSAAPVPVTFALDGAPVTQGGPSDPALDLVGEHGVAATLVAPFRIELQGAEALYWFDESRIRAVAFRDGEALPLITLPRPSSDGAAHFAAYWALRQQLLRGASPVQVPRTSSLTRR